ncbi:hypothetical protein N9D52_04450 [Flavobacteriaceae bacterium]|nr:hypothetical protein [Flavobacteriaceae bacterium]
MKKLLMLSLIFITSLSFIGCQSSGGIWIGDSEMSGKKFNFGSDQAVTDILNLSKAYSNKDLETLLSFYSEDFIGENGRQWTEDYLNSMESLSMEPYRIVPLHYQDSDFKVTLTWSKEERVYKNGSYEKLDLVESFLMDEDGKVKNFKQWVSIDSSNFGNRSGGKFIGDLNSEVSGRPFVFSNRNETAILEKLFENYNKMDAEACRVPFADIIEINDFDGNKKEIKNEDLLEAFSPYKSVKWTPISIVPIKIDKTDAASGVMVYSNEKRVSKNGKIWEKELMEIFYFNLEGKISSITQFAR